jgi:hypothetical protein
MATVDLTPRARGAYSHGNRGVYYVQNTIDFAVAATAKGSALAAADVLEALDVPAGTMILNAGIQVMTVSTGESADVTLDLGVTGVEVDNFVDGFDLDAAAALAYAQNAAAFQPLVLGSADTIDVLIATATTAPTGGKIRVWAALMNVADTGDKFGGSTDRNTLG